MKKTLFAAIPESGWWWNPEESGRGYNIEVQRDTVFIATFVYDGAGAPIWYYGAGKLENDRVTLMLMRSDGGQRIGCPYQAPTTSEGVQEPATIHFTSPGSASLTLSGREINIQRFNFATGKDPERLIGEWVFMTSIPDNISNYEGDRITFYRIENGLVEGSRTGVPIEFAIAKHLGNNSEYTYIAIIYRSISLNTVYQFRFAGLNKIEGVQALVFNDKSADDMEYALENYGAPCEAYRVN